MMAVQVVDGGIGSGAVIETTVTDADLRRAHAAAEPEPPADEPAFSPKVMAAFDLAKSAGDAQNTRSRRIVAEARRAREGEPAAVAVPAAGGQTAITDFGGGAE